MTQMVCFVKVDVHMCYQYSLPDEKLSHGCLTESILSFFTDPTGRFLTALTCIKMEIRG